MHVRGRAGEVFTGQIVEDHARVHIGHSFSCEFSESREHCFHSKALPVEQVYQRKTKQRWLSQLRYIVPPDICVEEQAGLQIELMRAAAEGHIHRLKLQLQRGHSPDNEGGLP
jgi:hypothetical protein